MNNQNDSTLTYIKVGDYYIPDLTLDEQPDKEIGVYGRMRERHLKEFHPGRYSYLISSGKLFFTYWKSTKQHRIIWTP